MTEVLKVLAQLMPTAAAMTLLYQTPAAKTAMMRSIVICNQGSAASTFSVSVAVDNAPDTAKQYLYRDHPIPARQTFAAQLDVALGPNDVVRCRGSGLSFSAFGAEVT